MREFSGTTYRDVSEEILSLAVAASATGESMFTVLNGVGLIADPRPTDPDYVDQLIWTYWVAFKLEDREPIGKREFYQNLVPELQALKLRLMAEWEHAASRDEKFVVQWLIRLVPATWGGAWVWDDGEVERLAEQLLGFNNRFIEQARQALVHPQLYRLGVRWIREARLWLTEQGN
jgi:hypothetical protein